MPVIVVGSEKNFAALQPRLLAGRVSTSAAREVRAAVEAANPHADLSALEPGTILTVPDLPKVSVRSEVSLDDSSRRVIAGLAEIGGTTLDELAAATKEGERAASTERKQLAKALSAKELDVAARKDKALAAGLKAARAAVDEENAAAKERAAALEQARAEWSAELKALQKLVP
ncbi:MAG TPA: hypothetical protein VH721_03540 [Gaiellaceae bacterium]|jgi:hypothetical protein